MKCDRNSTLFPTLSALSSLTLGLCLSTVPQDASAQSILTPDQTLGAESSRVERQIQPTPTDLITGGARRGQNLFHSFSDFNVGQGQAVYFSNPNGINNILTRVTGGSVSNIDSILGVRGNANLFIINPNGIIFGPDASLDVGGSFVATTANAIQFNEQDSFSATSPQTSSLLSVQPSAFFFNQVNSGEITNQSQAPFRSIGTAATGARTTTGLGVPEGKSLLLVGGTVNLDGGGVNSIFGRVEIASVQAGQTLGLNATDGELALQSLPSVQAENINAQNASVTNGSTSTTQGARGGLIRFQGKNLVLTNSSIIN
ncbi:MAG: filamentous hemagglutinin N-terminal domain-containing protein, partial [Thermosynechococcaceae cyanobacterium]